eukprot:scaffold14068_cov119-Isochrysis_galbana.AAC.8
MSAARTLRGATVAAVKTLLWALCRRWCIRIQVQNGRGCGEVRDAIVRCHLGDGIRGCGRVGGRRAIDCAGWRRIRPDRRLCLLGSEQHLGTGGVGPRESNRLIESDRNQVVDGASYNQADVLRFAD